MKKIGNYILFYIVLIPLSWLSMWFLYLVSSLLSFILEHIIGYRTKVVENNIRNSFPEFSEKDIQTIKNKFYKHLADVFLEAFKMLSISKKNLMKRYYCINPEVLNPYFENKQSVLLVSAHYNNWEYMVLSLDMQIKHHGIGVGKRMSNKIFGELMHNKRTRYGTEVCYADNTRETFERYERENTPCAYMLLADQSPNDKNRCYWTRFLNQDTPVIFGPESLAKKYNYPVFYYKVNKEKRGYYSFEFFLITDKPQDTAHGEITEKHVNYLESSIKDNPQYWLWSHKRWKHKRD